MRFVACLLVALALAASSARAAPAATGPVTLDGLQLGPFGGTPEQAARAALAKLSPQLGQLSRRSTLVLEKDAALPQGGHVVRFRQFHQGHPVLDAVVTVRLDEAGRVLRVASSALALNDVALTAKVTEREAIRLARQAVPVPLPADEIGSAIQIVVPAGGGTLAWQVFVPTLLPIHSLFVIVDAQSGEVLSVRDRAKFAGQGSVFPSGKAAHDARLPDGTFKTDPTPLVTQQLPGLTQPAPGEHLVGAEVLGYNCCPTKDCDGTTPPPTISGTVPLGFFNLPFTTVMCDEKPIAQGDAQGDYLYQPAKEPHATPGQAGAPPTSDPPVPAASDGDLFAEVMGYRYAQGAIDFTKSLDPSFQLSEKARPLRVTANFLFPDIMDVDPNQVIANRKVDVKTLMRFDNAAYVPAGSAEQLGAAIPGYSRDFDSLILFQGTASDFAYDPDVITHEMGHGVVEVTAHLADFSADQQGILDAPGAMNEGIADYWAAARENDPKVGEYVGDLTGGGEGALRTLENRFSCPSVISGEVHQDSQHFSAALWQARTKVTTDSASRQKFDQAVLAALRQMEPNSSFEQAAALIAGEVGKSFDSTAKGLVDQAFADKKVTGCERVVDLSPTAPKKEVLLAPADKARGWTPSAPGPIQFRLTPPKGATGFTLTAQGGPSSGLIDSLIGGATGGRARPSQLTAFVKAGSAVKFTYGGSGITNDSTQQQLFANGTTEFAAPITFDGGCDEAPVYVALGSSAQGQWNLQQLDVAYTVDEAKAAACAPPPLDHPDAGTPGAGGDVKSGGCGCQGVEPASVLALGALATLIRRRRR